MRQWFASVPRQLYGRRAAFFYAMFFIGLFTLVYKIINIKRHFEVPPYLRGRENTWTNCMYTSAMVQSNALPDVVPKTTVARMLFLVQVMLGWLWFMLLAA